jgi:hypothetical protein
MEFKEGFNPGQNNSYTEINFGPNSQYLPNVTELTIINGGKQEDKGRGMPKSEGESEEIRDITPIRTVILTYVSRLQPQVVDEWKQSYMKLWEGILDLDIVAKSVYKFSKQQNTDFNKYLVCNIIHYLRRKKIFPAEFNDSAITRALEGDDQHSIRTHAVNKDPDEKTCKALDNYIEDFKL